MNESVARVTDALSAFGGDHRIVEFTEPARTAADAARLLGCRVEQIANSLIFRAGDAAVLVMASGGRRVDPARVAEALGEPVGKADADFVRTRTGFAIGGVAPVGHTAPPAAILIDAELFVMAGDLGRRRPFAHRISTHPGRPRPHDRRPRRDCSLDGGPETGPPCPPLRGPAQPCRSATADTPTSSWGLA